jgi:DNA topoisomerase-1
MIVRRTGLHMQRLPRSTGPLFHHPLGSLQNACNAPECLLALERAPSPTGRKRQLASVYRQVSVILGNTPATARKSYIQRRVVEAFENGTLESHASDRPPPLLRTGEALVVRLLAGAPRRRRQGRAEAARTFDDANDRAAI